MDDLIVDFLTETNESLENLDVEIVNLEQNPNDKNLLGSIFRLVHTIKGTCGFLDLTRLEKIGHAAENILGRFRDGDLEVKPIAVSLIFESLDAIKEIVSKIEETQKEPAGNDQDLIDRLNEVYENGYKNVGEEATTQAKAPIKAEKKEATRDIIETEAKEVKTEELKTTAAAVTQSIRVSVDVLENLMTMVGELVLTRNQILQAFRHIEGNDHAASLQRLNHVTSELQESVMKTRMQPIGNAWSKLPRIIRDLSIELGKKIDLQMNGADTELDRQVIELIKDPLTHMIRNSGDHGIETPTIREAAGKKPAGTITLNAYHEGGHIIIQIIDDGKGLNTDRIKEKIIENNLATHDEIEGMSEKQIHQFIFKAGFSTAAAVTTVSGRGVGMDVVRTNIEKIGGTVDLLSIEGEGSTFTIKIPLTLAIVSSLIVECGAEKFAIPQLSITELVKIRSGDESQIEYIQNVPVLRLRDHLLPLISLKKTLQIEENEEIEEKKPKKKSQVVLVAHVGAYHFGMIVDNVCDTEEIVVKPTSSILRDIPAYAGNTILGDGSVIMILDPGGIASMAGDIITIDTSKSLSAKAEDIAGNSSDDTVAVLLFKSHENDGLKGVPLSLVSRLEEFESKAIEFSSGRHVIQYRDYIIPLLRINEDLSIDSQPTHPALVFSEGEKTIALIIHEILDIVDTKINIQMQDERESFIGNCIIDNKTVDLVNINYYLTQAYPNWFDAEKNQDTKGDNPHILFIDDSDFFRTMLETEISAAGYHVTTVNSAEKALKLCEGPMCFDLILTDIEMPEINGIDLARKIRELKNYKKTPIIALSGFIKPEYIEEGKTVGFVDYIAKNDREALIESISLSLSNTSQAA